MSNSSGTIIDDLIRDFSMLNIVSSDSSTSVADPVINVMPVEIPEQQTPPSINAPRDIQEEPRLPRILLEDDDPDTGPHTDELQDNIRRFQEPAMEAPLVLYVRPQSTSSTGETFDGSGETGESASFQGQEDGAGDRRQGGDNALPHGMGNSTKVEYQLWQTNCSADDFQLQPDCVQEVGLFF